MRRIFVYEAFSGGGHLGTEPLEAGQRLEMLEAGTAMREAIVEDLLEDAGFEVSAAHAGGATPRQAPRLAWSTPAAGETAEGFVARMARRHDFTWVIAPETGGLLLRLRRAVGSHGWVGCDEGAIRLTSSKSATLARLAACGLPTPFDFADPANGRWVVKPDDGAGALATRRHPDLESARRDLVARRASGRAVTLEPWVEGEALSITLRVEGGARGRPEILALNRQRLEVDASGEVHDTGVHTAALDVVHDPRAAALRTLGARISQAIEGLRGCVGIDLVWHRAAGPVPIEVNPRATCALVGLSRALGRNVASAVMADLVRSRRSASLAA